MRKLLFALLFLALTSLNVHAQVSENADRFTGETSYTYTTNINGPNYEGRLSAPTAIWSGILKNDKTEKFSMLFMGASMSSRSGTSWRYLGTRTIYWLIDGQRLEVDQPVYDGQVKRGFVIEFFKQFFTRAQFERLANAHTIEFRIGADEFSLSRADIASLKEILSKMPAPDVKPQT